MNRLSWYVNRLRCMTVPDVVFRLRQMLLTRWEACFDRRPQAAPAAECEHTGLRWFDGYVQDPERLRKTAEDAVQGRLRVLGLGLVDCGMPPLWLRDPKTGVTAALEFGPGMDLHDRGRVGDIKHLWEPSRHHDLVPVAQAWHDRRDLRFLDGAATLLSSWLEQNPHPLGPHWSSALECGIRLINWSLAWHLLQAADTHGELARRHPGLTRRWLDAVYWHLKFVRRRLSAHSSANNHLIGELTGLFVGLCTWPGWHEMKGWRAEVQQSLAQQALLQNTSDGVNREQASSYQLFVLEFLFIAGLCARAHGIDFEPPYWQRLRAMCTFVAALVDAGGHLPQIGDADDGLACGVFSGADESAASLLALGALIFERADLARAARRLDGKAAFFIGVNARARFEALLQSGQPLQLPHWFSEGGYAVLGCAPGTPDELRVVFDAGPLGYLGIAAHGHADALSVLLSAAGEPLLIDPGTYTYHGAVQWREHFRSTRAHNTLELDGVSQSQSGGRFMWVRHADARLLRTTCQGAAQTVVGEHDGYSRGTGRLTHRRSLHLDTGARELEVIDEVFGDGVHDAALRWHVAPGVDVEQRGSSIVLRGRQSELHMTVPEGMQCTVLRAREDSPQAWVSPGYERKVGSVVIECVRHAMRPPCKFVTRICSVVRAGVPFQPEQHSSRV